LAVSVSPSVANEIAGAPEFPAPGLYSFVASPPRLAIVLKNRAYTTGHPEFVAQSQFDSSKICLDQIGLELWLHQ
jgi:hypothetical protein